jgi:hypothetical protein
MSRRLKINVVVGKWGSHVMPGIWNLIAKDHDVSFLVLEGDASPGVMTSLRSTVFSSLPDMPGYYRDLETYVRGSDLVVAVEWGRLSSFQALRSAKSLGIPCVILAHEFGDNIKSSHANIQAIKYDIAQNADHFVCSSRRAFRFLASEGVEDRKISRIPAYFDYELDKYNSAKATKFRDYIKVKLGQKLIVGRCSFSRVETAENIVKGFRKYLSRLPSVEAVNSRLLLIGEGTEIEHLKYVAVDHGVGAQTIFMSQDPEPFWRDVCSASDLIIFDRFSGERTYDTFPFHMTQAMSSGVMCVIPSGSVFDEVAGEFNVERIPEFSVVDIEQTLTSVLASGSTNAADSRAVRGQAIEKSPCLIETAALMSQLFSTIVVSSSGMTLKDQAEKFVETFSKIAEKDRFPESLVKIEEFLLEKNLSNTTTAELWRIKGDLFAASRRTEEAVASYETAVQVNGKAFRAYCGLGYLAWSNHSHEEALTFFKRALGIEHNDYLSLLGIGLIYRRLRMLDDSLFWLGRALDIGGAESTALSLIVQACLESSEAKASLETLENLRESYGDLISIIRGLSQVYLAQGMPDKAAPLMERACA